MSSLLNALNPNAVQSRTRTRTNTQNTQVNYTPQPIHAVAQPPPGPAQSYVPHRSELEGAIVEPPPAPAPIAAPPPQPTPVAPPPVVPDQFAQILQFLTEGREAAAREQERRIRWEQEQEARFSQREAEIRETFSSMQERITELAELVTSRPATSTSGVSTPASFYRPTFPTLEQAYIPPDTPFSPMAQSPYAPSPTFVQGSSRQPILVHPIAMSMPVTPITAYSPVPIMTHATSTPPTHTPHTPHVPPPIPPHSHPQPILDLSTSPTASFPPTPANHPIAASPASGTQPQSRKRPATTESDEDNSSERPKSPRNDRPAKRQNGHDNRCLTIHAAMRAQLLRSMGLKSDKNLPDSHVEGQQLPDDRPVRFVWDKTPRGSSHNAAMKIRVIKELKENRVQQYRYVPETEFKDATVEGCFDQVFSTFRAKFKTQRDEAVAANRKQREETKAQKSRRVKRKKTKQASRTEMRRGLPIFSHSTFDPALQLECMSSEESCPEHEQSGTSNSRTKVQILKIRGLPWRSSRLLRFYDILDKAHQQNEDQSTKPKRPPQRKERSPGLPKEGFQVPPKAIAGWMLSRRWLKEMREEQPDWAESLRQSAADSGDFDWDKFDTLGVETEEESDVELYIPRSGASSLAHALAPAVG